METPLKTVKVVSNNPAHGGWVLINAADFNETKHTPYAEAAAKPAAKRRARKKEA